MALVVGILVALAVAGFVLLLASVAGGPRNVDESPWEAFRRGWAARRHPDEEQLAAAAIEPVDVSLGEFLSATVEHGDDGYLQVDELADTLQRARERATRAVPRTRRS